MKSLITQTPQEQYKAMLADVKKPQTHTEAIQAHQSKVNWFNEGFSITGSIVALIGSIALFGIMINLI